MTFRWLLIVGAGLALAGLGLAGIGLAAADQAQARSRHQARSQCVDRPQHFFLEGILLNRKPGPNGCAPPVFAYGEYIGQDPDPNLRHQLRRDPETGYAYGLMR